MDTFWLLASGGSTVEEFAKDVYLKSNLKNRIGFFIKQLLQDVYGQDDDLSGVGGDSGISTTTEISDSKIITEVSSPAVNSLINCFEATFLHGLKGKPLLNLMIGKASKDTNNQTEYKLDFWPVILILSHNQVSESLGQLNNICTDIGRCRAWLRLTLNDGLLQSYLEALINDTSLLHGFYRPSAYLRDKEHMDCLRDLMGPLKLATFQLNYDHSLLNNWTCDTLKLIGINVQDTAPIVAAVDALATIGDKKVGPSVVHHKELIRRRVLNRWDNGPSEGPGKSTGTSKESNYSDDAKSESNSRPNSTEPQVNITVEITQSDEDCSSSSQTIQVKDNQPNQNVKRKTTKLMDTKVYNSPDSHFSVIESTSKLEGLTLKDNANQGSNVSAMPPEASKSVKIKKSNLSSSSHLDESTSTRLPSSMNSDSMSTGGNSITNKGGWSTSPPGEEEEEPYESLLYSISTNAMLSSTPDIKEFIFSPPSDADNRSIVSNESERSPTPSNSISGRRSSSSGPKGLSIFKRKKSVSSKSETGRPSNTSSGSGTHGTIASPITSLGGNDFEIIPKTMILNSQEPETQEFLLHLTRIANHVGLDEQDYKCYSCGRPIGMIYGKFRVCEFDGFNYCTECHLDEKWVIPARIVNNWDFKKYPVANRNKKRLQLIESEPLIDIKVSASILYKMIKELQEILDLRTQLFYLHAYLFTCKEQVATGLRRILWPRDHLYEHIHLYATADLLQIQSGSALNSLLRKAIQFARKHVLSCVLCSQKGFICEICKSPQIIYPFDTGVTYRCDNCKAVFHISCFITESGKRPCPRCLRIRRRERAAVTV